MGFKGGLGGCFPCNRQPSGLIKCRRFEACLSLQSNYPPTRCAGIIFTSDWEKGFSLMYMLRDGVTKRVCSVFGAVPKRTYRSLGPQRMAPPRRQRRHLHSPALCLLPCVTDLSSRFIPILQLINEIPDILILSILLKTFLFFPRKKKLTQNFQLLTDIACLTSIDFLFFLKSLYVKWKCQLQGNSFRDKGGEGVVQ